jgi:hypothetical protein
MAVNGEDAAFFIEPTAEDQYFSAVIKEHRGAGVMDIKTHLAKLAGPAVGNLIKQGGTLDDVLKLNLVDDAIPLRFRFPDNIHIYIFNPARREWIRTKDNQLYEHKDETDS